MPSWEAWDAAHLSEHRLVAERDERVVGWMALAPVSARECYAGVAEVSVYVGEAARGQGVGAELLAFPENEASLRLLRRFGFRAVGTRERIGQLHGVWRDVVLLERRSEVVR